MFHVISAAWARLARRIADRQAVPFEYAAWHGWEVRHVGRGTYRFRDPRFGQLAAARTAPADAGGTYLGAGRDRGPDPRPGPRHRRRRGQFGRGA